MRGLGDTICAIATAAGSGGVGIVRVSGPDAEGVLRAVVRPLPAALESRRVYVGRAHDPATGAVVDEVLAFLMRGPRSYTGEDVAEVQGHGGAANLAAVLAATVRAGARVAEPGEFTRRAFLSGRLDLTQAEAVADVIAARSARAARQAQAQLGGALGRRVRELRGRVVDALAEVEAGLDFPEDDLGVAGAAELARVVEEVAAGARELAATFSAGRALREGIEVALVGWPNVGKSSLLNALAGEERAVVDPAPHTTRDFVEATVVWEGVAVTLIDTAGVVEGPATSAQGRAAALGQRRARAADVTLVVVEAGAVVGARERELWEGLGEGRRRVLVRSKADCVGGVAGEVPAWAGRQVVTSAVSGAGLGELRRAVLAAAGVAEPGGDGGEAVVVARERQRDALVEAAGAAAQAAVELGAQPAEVAAVGLRQCARALGRITGEEVTPDVLEAVFSRFCVGK